jgi:phospholipid/cholesterol/gamma-HCH transport system ATP-binding protein
MVSARIIAHRIAMLHEGRIIWSGACEALEASGNAVVDQFVQGRAQGPIT